MHLTQEQLEDYSRQQLRVPELLSVSEHLGACEECRLQIKASTDGDALFFALRSEIFDRAEDSASLPTVGGAHLNVEEMAGYVDRTLSNESIQIGADHLTGCEQCALAVADLRAFRNEIAPSLDREYHPLSSVTFVTEGWWRRTVASVSAPFQLSPGLAFGTALAVLLFGVTGWLILRALRERGTQEIVVAPAPSSPPVPIVSPSSPTQPAPPQPQPGTVVAQLNDGKGVLILDQQGKLSGTDLPLAYQSLVKKALTTGRVERSLQLNGLNRPASALMSSEIPNKSFSLLEPVGSVLVTDRPTFRWSPIEGAVGYVVEVYDSRFNRVAMRSQPTNQAWVASQPLARGEVYSWQVKATKDGQEVTSPRPPAPQAKFRILDQAKVNELAKARRAYGSSHLTLGLLYADAGLLKESEQELLKLQNANSNSELVRKLLRHVQALRRRNE